MAEKLYLIDGSSFAYRSFFAIRGLTDSKGEPTNAVFGFARILLKVLREAEPAYAAVIFDAPGKTTREEIYPEYKANRDETPPDLVAQMPAIDALVEALNLPLIRQQGIEADDIMGTLARRAEEAGLEAVLVTGDKDFLQLVSDHITIFDPGKGEGGTWIREAEVRERFGVGPEHVVDALGLMGDAADNIPGVKGIGEKTARKLLEQYGSIDGIYAHLDELKGKQRERIEQDRDMAYLSRQLVTIDTAIDVDLDLDAFQRKPFDRAKLEALLIDLEFHSLLEELLPETMAPEETDYQLVLDIEKLDAVIAEMRDSGCFAVDTETTSTDAMRARLVGISMSCRERTGYYIPLGHIEPGDLDDAGAGPRPDAQIPMEEALTRLRPLFSDPSIGKTGHNIKYDMTVLARAGICLQGVVFDTMVASYLTDPSRIRHNLDEVSLHYLKRKPIPIADLIGKGAKAITFDCVPIDRACTYASEDADLTWRLTERLRPVLCERELDLLFDRVELPLIGILAAMEQAGVAIDTTLFDGVRQEVERRQATLRDEIFEAAGETFQINSPKQLQGILFDKLGLKPIRKTKSGYSTDVDVLEQLALEHPLPEKILAYRTLEKLRGAYIDALPKLVHPETGRIHTSFNQAVAATGRLSSSDPNLQNIPVRTEIGRRIRQGFVAGVSKTGQKMKLISADYSQIELRVLAHLTGDKALREAFEQDMDIHRDTAARVFNVMPELVSDDMRRQAKAVNFGVIYGISAFGLARNLGISRGEAAKFIDAYFSQYSGVRQWMDQLLAEARECGYVTTLLKRRRYVADLNSKTNGIRQGAERVAINTPVQGSAADIIKLAMVRLADALAGTGARMLLQVHDELLVEAEAPNATEIAGRMREVMEQAYDLDVPLKVDIGIGDTWAEAH